jgi:transcriptional regulator with XRE-family HTH domain
MVITPEQVFGEVLREIRRSRRLSQERLAEVSGCHRTYVSLLERGVNGPSLSMLFQLGQALGITPSDILARVERRLSEAAHPPSPEETGPK